MQHTSRLNYRIIQKGFKTINRNLYTLYFREIYPLIFWHIALIFNPQPFKAIWMLFHMCCFCCCCFCPPTSLLLCLEVFFPIFVEKLLGSRRWPLTWCFIYLENVTVWKFSICFFSLELLGLRREEQATHVELQIPFLLVRASCVPVREQVSRRLQPDHFQTCMTGLLSICLFLSIPLPYQEVKH